MLSRAQQSHEEELGTCSVQPGATNEACSSSSSLKNFKQEKKIPVVFFPDGDIPVCPVSPTPPLSTSNGAKEDAGSEPSRRLPEGNPAAPVQSP